MSKPKKLVPLIDASIALKLSWRQTYDRACQGRLDLVRLPNGRWAVTRASIARYRAELEAATAPSAA